MQDLGVKVIFEGANLYRLLMGLLITAKIAFIAILISSVLGTGLGIIMTSKKKALRVLARVYLELIRIIPILVWLFIFYFSITKILQVHLEGEFVAIIVFSLWGTAEMGDLVRGAIIALPKHQKESGRAIGLTEQQVYRYIILPQAVKQLVPGAINLMTRMIKTTSLVALIGVVEVLKVGQQIIEVSLLDNPTASFWVYGFIFLLYFIICYPISVYSKKLEQKWQD